MTGTDRKIDTPMAREDSRPVLYEIVAKDGVIHGPLESVKEATKYAKHEWPDQEQGEDRKGLGWDIQVAGID